MGNLSADIIIYKMAKKKGKKWTTPMRMSPELAAIVGARDDEMLSRSQIVRRLWAYLKKHKLQDPSNKQFFTPDKLMQPVFGKKRIRAITMPTYIESHLIKDN